MFLSINLAPVETSIYAIVLYRNEITYGFHDAQQILDEKPMYVCACAPRINLIKIHVLQYISANCDDMRAHAPGKVMVVCIVLTRRWRQQSGRKKPPQTVRAPLIAQNTRTRVNII